MIAFFGDLSGSVGDYRLFTVDTQNREVLNIRMVKFANPAVQHGFLEGVILPGNAEECKIGNNLFGGCAPGLQSGFGLAGILFVHQGHFRLLKDEARRSHHWSFAAQCITSCEEDDSNKRKE